MAIIQQERIGEARDYLTDPHLQIKSKDYSNETLQLTSRLLTRNPEYYTIWNHRRLVLQDVFQQELQRHSDVSSQDTPLEASDIAAASKANHTPAQQEITLLIREDLHFLLPLLKQFPKCYWIWNHRAWLLASATTHLPPATALELWRHELALVSKMLALDGRNFHGWGYRRIAVEKIETISAQDSAAAGSGSTSLAQSEFDYTTKMISSNLSNFSAWHARSRLLPRLLSEQNASQEARIAAYDAEITLLTRALYTDPYDQSLWTYHHFLMTALDPIPSPSPSPSPGGTQATSKDKTPGILGNAIDLDDALRHKYLIQESENLRDMLDGAEDCKYIYQALLENGRLLGLKKEEKGEGEDDEEGKKRRREEMKSWLEELRKLDQLRKGRWEDLGRKLGL
jgi:geranylgeranyl transferase type-2 subunit alpha